MSCGAEELTTRMGRDSPGSSVNMDGRKNRSCVGESDMRQSLSWTLE